MTKATTRTFHLCTAAFVLVLLALAPERGHGAAAPLKPHDQLVDEVAAFLMSDVGTGGIRTEDDDPLGAPVPPYFYHYAIHDDDGLPSNTSGYPGFASISYPGYTAAVAIDAFLAYWAYTGNQDAFDRADQMARWLMARRTPAGDVYGNWVYSTQTDGVMGGGFDGDAIMSDKPAMFALRCLRLYDIGGDAAFLETARETADTYVATQLSGGPADDGRWPFRVRPSDGLVRQDYTSHLIPAIRLLESMEQRVPGNGYGGAAQRAWSWLLSNPLDATSVDYMHWEAFYEDIDAASMIGLRDHYGAESTLEALLERDAPGDVQLALDIFQWSTDRYLAPDSFQNGYGSYAPALLEWDAWLNSTYAATGQWGWVCLLLDRATEGTPLHDASWRSDGLAAMHTLTYGQGVFAPPSGDGRMLTTIRELTHVDLLNQTWYEQNFNTVKYLLLAMGLAPELAPTDEDHLLRFEGSELSAVSYEPQALRCSFSAPGSALFKLRTAPAAIRMGGAIHLPPGQGGGAAGHWSWDAAQQLCTVNHPGGEVELLFDAATSRVPRFLGEARLLAPHPNPFNPRVLVPFELLNPGPARLSVVDARGRRVALLHDGQAPAGRSEAVWNGRDSEGKSVASGAYRLLLEAAGQTQSRAVVLSR